MPQFGLNDRPFLDPIVESVIDQDVITPLQTLSGGVWGLGVWRRYNLTDLLWSTRTVGSTLTIPKNMGALGVTKIGDHSMLFSINTSTPFTVVGANATYVQFQLPDGISYANRQPIADGVDSSGCITPCLIVDSVAGWDTGFADPGFFAPNLVHFVNIRGGNVFTAGRNYNIFGQWVMEIAVAGQHY